MVAASRCRSPRKFIDAAYEGELVEGHGEVVRAGGSILFLRATLTSAGRPVLTFSGTIKRIVSGLLTPPCGTPAELQNAIYLVQIGSHRWSTT